MLSRKKISPLSIIFSTILLIIIIIIMYSALESRDIKSPSARAQKQEASKRRSFPRSGAKCNMFSCQLKSKPRKGEKARGKFELVVQAVRGAVQVRAPASVAVVEHAP